MRKLEKLLVDWSAHSIHNGQGLSKEQLSISNAPLHEHLTKLELEPSEGRQAKLHTGIKHFRDL